MERNCQEIFYCGFGNNNGKRDQTFPFVNWERFHPKKVSNSHLEESERQRRLSAVECGRGGVGGGRICREVRGLLILWGKGPALLKEDWACHETSLSTPLTGSCMKEKSGTWNGD